ncbi:hypothetical protein J5690_05060 [bacterium]|nr:hypothetical protein [bacterium]
MRKTERLDFVGAFEHGWIQYKSNFTKLAGWGAAIAVPPVFFHFSITAGVVLTLIFEGFFMILLANSIICASRGLKNDAFSSVKILWSCFKNGFLTSILLFPMLIIGAAALIIPSVAVFSIFMFTFFISASKQQFAVDAMAESLRKGNESRLPLFLFSLIFYAAAFFAVFLEQLVPSFGFIAGTLITPYFFSVIYEFYEQLEKKYD